MSYVVEKLFDSDLIFVENRRANARLTVQIYNKQTPLVKHFCNFFSRNFLPHRPTPTATNSCTPKNFLHHRTTIGYIKIFCTFLLKTLDKGGLGILYLHRIDSRKWSVRHSVGQRAVHNQKKHIKQSIFLTKDRATLARSQKIIYLYEKI